MVIAMTGLLTRNSAVSGTAGLPWFASVGSIDPLRYLGAPDE
jgi:hypothetical protein